MKDGLYVGQLYPNVGRVTYKAYETVKNYNPNANVNQGCQLIVEGCMDATAANYEPKANVNTNTWCIPKVEGCMMPDTRSATTQAMGASRKHMKDGGSGSFWTNATINKVSMCTVGRMGCTSPTALNYDVKATIDDGTCFERIDACLDRSALNFNCTVRQAINGGFQPCTADSPRGSVHAEVICVYEIMSPPPPSPAVPYSVETTPAVRSDIVMSGTVSDFPESRVEAMKGAFGAKFNVDINKVRAEVKAASVLVTFFIEVADEAAAESLNNLIAPELESPTSAADIFASMPDPPRVVATSPPETVTIAAITPPGPPPETPVGAIVGGVFGGTFPVFVVGLVYMQTQKKKKKATTYPA
jgi:hypothetical protein